MESHVLHITEAELVRDVRAILEQVRTGAEVIIERDSQPVAVLRSATARSTLTERLAASPDGSTATLDPDFAEDVEEIIRNRRPLTPLAWD